jgi:hypothetical protein
MGISGMSLDPCEQCVAWRDKRSMLCVPASLENRWFDRVLCASCVHYTYGLTVVEARARISEKLAGLAAAATGFAGEI